MTDNPTLVDYLITIGATILFLSAASVLLIGCVVSILDWLFPPEK